MNKYFNNNSFATKKTDSMNGNNHLNIDKSHKNFNAEEYFDNLMNSMKKK